MSEVLWKGMKSSRAEMPWKGTGLWVASNVVHAAEGAAQNHIRDTNFISGKTPIAKKSLVIFCPF